MTVNEVGYLGGSPLHLTEEERDALRKAWNRQWVGPRPEAKICPTVLASILDDTEPGGSLPVPTEFTSNTAEAST